VTTGPSFAACSRIKLAFIKCLRPTSRRIVFSEIYFHSFQTYFVHASNSCVNICCMPITNLQVSFPREEKAHTGQSDIVCFSFSLHSDTFPPTTTACKVIFSRKFTSHPSQQSFNHHLKKTDMILDDTVASKIRLPQSFKQRFFEHQSSPIYSPVPLIN
jgi:hypothetical protein